MKANELRIGNWVNIGKSIHPEFILSIEYKRGIEGNYLVNGYEVDLFSGIPLTPDILEKAGFEDDSYANFTKIMSDNPLSNSKDNGNYILRCTNYKN